MLASNSRDSAEIGGGARSTTQSCRPNCMQTVAVTFKMPETGVLRVYAGRFLRSTLRLLTLYPGV